MLVTPFDERGNVSLRDLGNLVSYVLGSGAHGLSVLGLGGEVSRLDSTERLTIARFVLSSSAGSPVIVGCTARETNVAVTFARDAAEHGAAAVMLAPPSDPRQGRAELLHHFAEVAEAIGPVPLMIQDAPAFLGVELDDAFATDLGRACPNVRYAKPERLPAAEYTSRLAGAGFAVFGGHGGLYAMDVLEAGAVGLIPGCEAPRSYATILESYLAGRRDEAWSAFSTILPLATFQFQGLDFFIACVKHLLHKLGVVEGEALRGVPNPLSQLAKGQLLDRARRAGVLHEQRPPGSGSISPFDVALY